MLRLFLFGLPRIELNGRAVRLHRTKALALLAYLAATRQPQDRDALLALLWPEFDADSARNNLRRELSLLKTVLGEDVLIANRLQVAWNDQVAAWIDVAVFEAQVAIWKQHAHAPGEACAACVETLTTAAQLYTGDFLAGFGLPDSPAFDEWQFFQCEELRHQLAAALQSLSSWHRAADEYDPALAYARRWLALDRLHEPAQRELMRLYAWAGQQSAALRQYNECARLLDTELGAEPEPETTALYEAIRTRRVMPPTGSDKGPPRREPAAPAPQAQTSAATQRRVDTATPRSSLPPQPTSFFGRANELHQTAVLLADPACRLLTLVGPGGIGKTRLAIELAAQQQAVFADGVCFVALQAIDDPATFVFALADTLQVSLRGPTPPHEQLITALQHRHLLLVLDNFEHLLDGRDLVSTICAAAPRVKLLVTAREVLNLQEEWRYPLHGLDVPTHATSADIARWSAPQLFTERARRVRRDFALQHEQEAVVRICQLVGGSPLAIELAAAWARTLSCPEIAAEIARNTAFLATTLRNVPERHRSLQAVFDYSWERLTDGERAVLMRLSIFRSSFTRTAAEHIAGASLAALVSLVDKSLLRHAPDGRYDLHELVRQFARARLHEHSEDAQRTEDAYGLYYAQFLREQQEAALDGQQYGAFRALISEFENVRGAMSWIVERADDRLLRQSIQAFYAYYLFHGPCLEGVSTLQHAAQHVRCDATTLERRLTLATLLVQIAWLIMPVGQVHEARAMLEESAALYVELSLLPEPGLATDPTIGLAVLALNSGDYAEAARLGQAMLARRAASQERGNAAYANYVLTNVALAQGHLEAARHYAQYAYGAAKAVGDEWFTAYCLIDLGIVASALGRYAEAHGYFEAAYTVREAFGDPWGMALARAWAGKASLLQHDAAAARSHHQQSLELYQYVGDRGGIATALNGLGMLACEQRQYAEAQTFLYRALQLTHELQFVTHLLMTLGNIAALMITLGWVEQGVALLILVLRHPASDREANQQAQDLLLRYDSIVPPAVLEAAMQRGQTEALESAVARLLVELAVPLPQPEHAASSQLSTSSAHAQPLADMPDTSRADGPGLHADMRDNGVDRRVVQPAQVQ